MKTVSKCLCLALCLIVLLPVMAGNARAAEEAAISRNQYDPL